jgi:voltage-gated potassium channel
MEPFRRAQIGLIALGLILVVGTVGYVALGMSVLDAIYQTVTTISTVGFGEIEPLEANGRVFTIVMILVGVGTALYTFTALLETFIEGHLTHLLEKRRMERDIARLRGHVIVCGWGRVGRAIAEFVTNAGDAVVVVDRNGERLGTSRFPIVQGDITQDEVLLQAGIDRARVLVAAVNTDADNLYVTLSARTLRPDLVIIARARTEAAEAKLERAGANRVVNPQRIGGDRMAAFALQPHVVDFLDIVMHDGSLEFRLEEIAVPPRSPLAGTNLRQAQIRERTGALVLAMRQPDHRFVTNPPPETVIEPEHILIAIGTAAQLSALSGLAVSG